MSSKAKISRGRGFKSVNLDGMEGNFNLNVVEVGGSFFSTHFQTSFEKLEIFKNFMRFVYSFL